MANRSVLRSTLLLSRAHLLLLRPNNNKPSFLSNPLFQHDSSLQTLIKPFSSFTITNPLFQHKDPMTFGKDVKLDSSSAITQGEISIVKRKPGRPRKIRPAVVVVVDETVSLTPPQPPPPPSLSSLSPQTQKRGRGRPPGSGKKKVVELESSPVSSVPSSSLSQSPETQKRGRGRPPGSGKKKVVELESSPVSSVLSSSLAQSPETQKRGRGRPPGSGKKKEVELESSPVVTFRPSSNEMLKQQSLKEEWGEQQGLKKLEYTDFERALLMDQREERKLEERKLKEQQGLKNRDFEQVFLENMAILARSNNMLNPWEDFNKVKNKRDLPDLDISFCYLDEDCLIIE